MRRISIIILGLFLIIPHTLSSQGRDAQMYYGAYSLQDAISKYSKVLKKEPTNGDALFNLANAYRLNGENQKAESWFEKAVMYDSRSKGRLYYAQVLMSNGKYGLAQKWFNEYAMLAADADNIQNARQLAQQCGLLEQNGISYEMYSIKAVDFNSKALDFSPNYYGGSKLVFASSRDGGKSRVGGTDPWTGGNFVDLWTVERRTGGVHGEPEILTRGINSKYHEGPASFAQGGRVMYFTRNDYHRSKRGYDAEDNTRLMIYQATLSGEKWKMEPDLNLNSNMYNTCHPALSRDGKTMVFASDRPGGYGGMDLWLTRGEGSTWSPPVNLGPSINTVGNELFPYLSNEGNLYFSSDFLIGIGGLDMFQARAQDDLWGRPTNLGAPLNSPKDDFGLITDIEMERGYFTSNRSGEKDDIYYFTANPRMMVEGIVVNCLDGQPIEGANVVLEDGINNPSSTISDEKGKFSFMVDFGREYEVTGSKDNFIVNSTCTGKKSFRTKEEQKTEVIKVELGLTRENFPEKGGGCTISGVIVNEKYRIPIPNSKVTLISKCTGEEYELITDRSGAYSFPLPDECEYILQVDKAKFRSKTLGLDNKNCDPATPTIVDIPLTFIETYKPDPINPEIYITEGMTIELKNIYFDLDKSDIRPDAVPDLDILLQLLRKYPSMRGEIMAHTDSRASINYNNKLSQRRAESSRQYLINRGVDPSRLTARGYGEYVLKNRCSDGVPCSEAEHQRNRRVEFKVTNFDEEYLSKERYFADSPLPKNFRNIPESTGGPIISSGGKPGNISPSQMKSEPNLTFRIQFGLFDRPLNQQELRMLKLQPYEDPIYFLKSGSNYMYFVGQFYSYDYAEQALLKIQSNGYKDSEVVGFKDGRIMKKSELRNFR